MLPVHAWDLTACINYDNNTVVRPNIGLALGTAALTSNAASFTWTLDSQDPSGARQLGSPLTVESGSGGYDDLPKRKALHHWSHIKMNLYGVRKRASKFLVQLVMIKNQEADFYAPDTNMAKRKLIDALARPYIYSNLNSGDPQTLREHLKVLKTYEVTIAPTTADDYGGTANAVPHTQTLNWFIEHNRVRRYDHVRRDTPDTGANAAYDQESPVLINTRTTVRSRVYLLVRALAPERRDSTDWTPEFIQGKPSDPITEPSYDLVIRQKFSVPT